MTDKWEDEGGAIRSGIEGGIVPKTPWGDIQVYREYRYTTNRIEFTIYFRLSDGIKYRMDIDMSWELADRLVNDPEGPGFDNYMYDLMAKLIKDGNYIEAGKAFSADGNNDYKGYSID